MYNRAESESLPFGQEQALEAIEFGLKESSADVTEILIMAERTDLTRFANLAIHQNVSEISYQAFFRTIWCNRVVVIESNDLSRSAIKETLHRSQELAGAVSPSAIVPDFAHTVRGKQPALQDEMVTFNPATAACGLESRAEIVNRICGVFRTHGVNGSGNIRVQQLEMAVGNSAGLRRYTPFSIIGLIVTATDETNWSSGYNNWIGRDIEASDPEGLATVAAMKCLMGRKPKVVEAKPMTAILEPLAVAQLLFHLNYRSLGLFGAKSAGLRENFIFDHIGKTITSPMISIHDDATTEGLVPMPFDFEGVEKKCLELVTKGVAKGIAHNLTTAIAFKQSPTGHALPPTSEFGPTPLHLVMDAGDSSVSDMIESTEYGVLVSRIHGFVNPLSSKQGYLAGTTRDGLFLVENGRISGPIRNLRWMDRIFSAFDTVEAISRARKVHFTDELWFPTMALVPTIKLGKFNFVDVQRWTG